MEKADAIFQNLALEEKVPGLAVTISANNEVLLQKGYGYARLEDKTPVDPQRTIFRIASVSKCITGLALAKMVEEGILDWDDSIYNHVPYYPKKEFDITLRQLAGHTAGIRGYRGKEYALNRAMSIKDSLELFKNDSLKFEPGKGYLYNSYDFVLLSLAMEEASGMAFNEYVSKKILVPLGMEHTFTPDALKRRSLDKEKELPKATFYTKYKVGIKNAVTVDNQYKIAGGGYLSTSNDIDKLGRCILNKELLPDKEWDQLLSSQLVNGNPTYYGLGFQVSQDSLGRDFVGHVGNSVGVYSNFFVYPKTGLVISLLINCTDPKVQTHIDEAIEAI
ncbi:serine hydrolase domain-containing protein [Flagellimonas flava]|uniref:serine hydrolase domain-containing protein n=1 Tax=Flagellimonas flava TaxID=570519 RepID=UPI001FE978E0|nr:serine hydrolase domain-containing protein [Allomuricauda flava]